MDSARARGVVRLAAEKSGVPPAGAALANAIHAATGVRVRELPVGRQLAGWRDRRPGASVSG